MREYKHIYVSTDISKDNSLKCLISCECFEKNLMLSLEHVLEHFDTEHNLLSVYRQYAAIKTHNLVPENAHI